MVSKKLLLNIVELVQELDKTSKPIECEMIINDMEKLIERHTVEQLNIHNVSQQSGQLFCGGCGNKKQLIVETDINSQRVCKNKLCKQNNCG